MQVIIGAEERLVRANDFDVRQYIEKVKFLFSEALLVFKARANRITSTLVGVYRDVNNFSKLHSQGTPTSEQPTPPES